MHCSFLYIVSCVMIDHYVAFSSFCHCRGVTKDHLDAQERKQDKSTLETPVNFEEEILDAEVQENEAIPLSDEEIAHDAASSEGGPIAQTTIPGTDFVLKNHIVRLLRQNCQFNGFRDEDANEHLNKYLSITQFMKQNGVSQDNISLNLFPFSLTYEAESWFYHLKTHSIHTWEEMILKFLSKYYPHSRALQLRKDIMNFRQLPIELVFEAWERFKSCLRKCPDHRISLIDQIFTFYHGITMVDQDKIMVAVGPGHPNTVYYSDDSDKSDEDEPYEVLDIQKPIHSLSGNPTPSSDLVVESLSPLHTPFGDSDSLLEETDTLLSYSDDSLPDYKTFCFDIEEKSSCNNTSQSDHSLPDYESFCFDVDHIEEKSSGSTTSHSDLSLLEYDSFHFDLLIDPLPPADRSDSQHEEFADELAHIISPPEYDHFYFYLEADPGELTRILKKNISDTLTKDLKIHELDDFSLLLSDCDSIFSEEFSDIDFLVLFTSGNKDKVFDPGIFTINGVHSKRFSILLLDDFSSILFV
ncbi:reverse transcriptase domain-containing protein, partial [Tanacetum coccineum]